MNWFNARDLAQAGTPIRRLPWTDKWITYWRGLWWCHIRDTAPRVVRTTDFGKPEFLAEDWTTIAAEREDCPPVIPPIVDPVDLPEEPPIDPPQEVPPVTVPIVDPPSWPPGFPPITNPINPNPPSPAPTPTPRPRPPARPHPTGFTLTATASCIGVDIVVECRASVSDAISGDRWMISIRGTGTKSAGSGFAGPGEEVVGTFQVNAATYAGRTLTYTANFSELDHPGGSASFTITLPSCEPECYPYVCYDSPSGGYIGECAATPYCNQTITNPFSTSVTVQITGSVDDELLINGSPADAGCCIYYICNGAHSVNHVFTLAGGASFTLAAGDNHGASTGYTVDVCFDPVAPPP